MGSIRLLEDDVINKIAAGEVVERPASVVKELVENALDAGATDIEISLELGGIRSIVVTDNGAGMTAEDAALAMRRHATSKIRGADDLFKISTMGFRGEAIASIAAVSHFSLATCTGTEPAGQGGVKLLGPTAGTPEPLPRPWNGPRGTTIAVENLFHNMPVRAKFLKSPATEFSHCLELIHAFALAQPHVGFTLRHNGREQLRLAAVPSNDLPGFGAAVLQERGLSILGNDGPALIYVQASGRFGELEALISPPGVEKATGKSIFTFANGRLVKDKVLRYGILRGYHSHLLKGRFPVVLLHLRCDPALIDVNVHPAKTEVRFQYPDEVQNLIALAIRGALRSGAWAAPELVAQPLAQHRELGDLGTATAPFAADGRSRPNTTVFPDLAGADFPGSAFLRPSAAAYTPQPSDLSLMRPSRPVQPPVQARPSIRSFGGAATTSSNSQWPAATPVVDKAGIDRLLAGFTEQIDHDEATGNATCNSGIDWDQLEYLGAFDRCYLMFAQKQQLLVIDQHAFHERILFERLVADASLLAQSQRLLVPEALELSPTEVAQLLHRAPELKRRGFDFKSEGPTTLLVTAVPTLLAGRDLSALFSELAQDLTIAPGSEPTASNAEMTRLILATAACHAAVRAGEELPPAELRQLLAQARKVDFMHNCPHGRRVFKWWSNQQVAQWFDR